MENENGLKKKQNSENLLDYYDIHTINLHSFHLVGIVPVAGHPLDFNFEWDDCLMPIAPNFTMVERAVLEAAWAGCRTIWVVCRDPMIPLIKYRLGESIRDPKYVIEEKKKYTFKGEHRIPIYYVPISIQDKGKRDNLSWSVIHGVVTAHVINRNFSRWVIPDKYYVAFPYGVYPPESIRPYRKKIISKKNFYITHNGKTVKDNEYLGFTLGDDDLIKCRRIMRKEGTKHYDPTTLKKLPKAERYSARFFDMKKVFEPLDFTSENKMELKWYFNVDSWDKYCYYLGSEQRKNIVRPSDEVFIRKEWNKIGYEEE